MATIDRKELKTPDAFFQGIGTANRFFHDNRGLVVAAAVGLVAVFLIGVGWRSQRNAAADRAAAAFLRATDAMEESSPAAARSALTNVAESSRTPYASLSSLYLAELTLKDGDAEAAAAEYAKAAKELKPDYLKQAALVGQAFALEQAGKTAEAASAYSAAAAAGATYKEQALRGQLRAARAAGDTGLVKAAIQALLDGYPQSAGADDLAAELSRLEG
jgi:hypothetical protein